MLKYTIIALLLISSLAFTEAQSEHKPLTRKDTEKLATAVGVVYVGMPKEDLYKVYTKEGQKGYYKDGDEEWITFSEWMTEESGDRITFYLRGGKVKGWKEE